MRNLKDDGENEEYVSPLELIKKRWQRLSLLYTLASVCFYTVFSLFFIVKNWGSDVYIYVYLGVVGVYVIIFALLLFFGRKNSASLKLRAGDYKSGLKIIRGLLRLMNIGLPVSIAVSLFAIDETQQIGLVVFFRTAAIIIASLQLLFQIFLIVNRHIRYNKKKKRRENKS